MPMLTCVDCESSFNPFNGQPFRCPFCCSVYSEKYSDKHCDVESVKDQFPVSHVALGEVKPGDIVRYVEKSKGMTKEELFEYMENRLSDVSDSYEKLGSREFLVEACLLEELIKKATGEL